MGECFGIEGGDRKSESRLVWYRTQCYFLTTDNKKNQKQLSTYGLTDFRSPPLIQKARQDYRALPWRETYGKQRER